MTSTYTFLHRVARAQSGKIFACLRRPSASSTRQEGVTVAVKCATLPEKTIQQTGRLADDPRQEQRVASMLIASGGHPNLVQYYESFEDRGRLFLIMEYCPEGDLFTHIHSFASQMLSEAAALRFFWQILRGVQFLHQHDVVHRDLSLENVLLNDGECKVADFGLSTDADRVCTELVGKTYYMAPEIVAGKPYDPKRADVWSLGMMLFIMLTGSPLVAVTSPDDKGLKALATYGVEKILVVWGMREMFSSETVGLLSGMLQVDPNERLGRIKPETTGFTRTIDRRLPKPARMKLLRQLWRARVLQQQQALSHLHYSNNLSQRVVHFYSSGTPQPAAEKLFKRQVPISITGVSDQGDGVGVEEESGVQVHVPFALPGERLLVEIWERDFVASKKWKATKKEPKWPVFGQNVAVLKESEHRVTPQCAKFFGACGGCKQQHLAYAQQLVHKQKRIEELFYDRSHSSAMQLRPILGAEQEHTGVYEYRNKMEFTCSTGRWLLDSDKVHEEDNGENNDEDSDESPQPQQQFPFTIGLFPVSSTSVRRMRQIGGKRRRGKGNASWSPRILSIDDCSLQGAAGNKILKQLSTRLEEAGIEAYNFQTNQGFLKQLVIRKGTNAEKQIEIMIGLVTTSLDGDQSELLKSVVNELVQDFETSDNKKNAKIVSVVQCLDEQTLRLQGRGGEMISEKERTLFGQSFFHDTILDHNFQVSFGSFFQPNTAQASRLYHEIQKTMSLNQDLSDHTKKPVIWDLFCGVGSIGICMGKFGSKVYGFEIVEAAVEKAKLNARLNGYLDTEMQFFTMDLTKKWDENEWSDKVENPDIVIVDPPRAGLHNKLIKLLRKLGPPQICYVSCNPESQVQDLELLCKPNEEHEGEGDSSGSSVYEVDFLQPVDMLPHTPHIETIAWLRRRS